MKKVDKKITNYLARSLKILESSYPGTSMDIDLYLGNAIEIAKMIQLEELEPPEDTYSIAEAEAQKIHPPRPEVNPY